MNSNYTMVLAPGSIYKCLYISHYKINLGKLIQETEWPFSVQRPHRRQPSPKNSFSPWNLVTASLQPPNRTFSELAICKSSSPSQKYISSAYRQEWQNGVRTWRRVTCFFFFHLRHCREGGGMDPMMVAPWDEANGDAVVMRILGFIRYTGVQSLDRIRKRRLESFPCG